MSYGILNQWNLWLEMRNNNLKWWTFKESSKIFSIIMTKNILYWSGTYNVFRKLQFGVGLRLKITIRRSLPFTLVDNRKNWLFSGAASVAKGVMVFVDALTENQISNFLKNIVPLNSDLGFLYLDFFSPIIIIVFTIAMACGMKNSTIVKNIFTVCSLLLTLSIIIAGSFKGNHVSDLDKFGINLNYI